MTEKNNGEDTMEEGRLPAAQLSYVHHEDWPVLAWLATARAGSRALRIDHGSDVDTRHDWCCEAVWDGEFDAGNFDGSDIVFGSGVRVRPDGVYFVSSASTVDRIHALEADGHIWVSNSLPCLLRAAGAQLDPGYPGYYEDFWSVVRGLSNCVDRVATTRGDVRLVYFHNLKWDGRVLATVEKPSPERDFGSFDSYRNFLSRTMQAMSVNMQAPERSHGFEWLSTLSRGYDSTAVSVLARDAGCRQVLCFDRARKGENDSGFENARTLGLEPVSIQTYGWRELRMPEIPFVAANAMGEEVRLKAAEGYLRRRVLATGYHGDKIWDKHTKDLSAGIVRGDPSGSALTEYRLEAGFIHVPVPFWGVRQIAAVNRISNSDAMRPWDWGGAYSRPICRRIGEEAGLARESFGVNKLAASVMLHEYDNFLTPGALDDYLVWLRQSADAWRAWGRKPVRVSRSLLHLDASTFNSVNRVATWLKRLPYVWRWGHKLDRRNHHHYLRAYIFPWAIERRMAAYEGTEGHSSLQRQVDAA